MPKLGDAALRAAVTGLTSLTSLDLSRTSVSTETVQQVWMGGSVGARFGAVYRRVRLTSLTNLGPSCLHMCGH